MSMAHSGHYNKRSIIITSMKPFSQLFKQKQFNFHTFQIIRKNSICRKVRQCEQTLCCYRFYTIHRRIGISSFNITLNIFWTPL